jgi:hypothetical protein
MGCSRWILLLIVMLAVPAGSADSADNYLTVDAYCSGFCDKLCGTCGAPTCQKTCKPRCYNGRAASLVMDGREPKVALARKQKDLDECVAKITTTSCPAIMAGQVPPACFTIQR